MKALDLMQAIMAAKPDLSIEGVYEIAEQMIKKACELEKKILFGDNFIDTTNIEQKALPEKPKKPEPVLDKIYKKDDFKFKTPEKAVTDKSITCCICGAEKSVITSKHLAKHGTTKANYLKSCGYAEDFKLMSKNALMASMERMKKAQVAPRKKKS